MQQQRQLSNKTKGMFGGPRGEFGQYLDNGVAQISGTTYGGQGLGRYWQAYPSIVGGMTEIDPEATVTGSNLSAVLSSVQNARYFKSQTAIDAGLDGLPTGSMVGGTSF